MHKISLFFFALLRVFAALRELLHSALFSHLTRQIANEWHWKERKRTSLTERKEFLEISMEPISTALDEAEPEGEVQSILSSALDEYKKLFEQIDWIITSSENESDIVSSNRDEATATIESLLIVIPKRREALSTISEPDEYEKERLLLISGLKQGLEAAKDFKLSKFVKTLEEELALLEEAKK